MVRTPRPEDLAKRQAPQSQRVVTFRLSDPEHAALLSLAERADLGPSAFARRIVEHYINEHVPQSRRNRR